MSVETDAVRRIVAAASIAAVYGTLPGGAQPSRATTIGSCFLRGRRQGGPGCSAVSRTTGRPAEVLREGSGLGVDGTAGEGLTVSRYIKDAGNLL